jgi:iron-sulfur cluster assembly protein
MTVPDETTTNLVTLTHPAASAVRDIITQKNLPDCSLRLYITGGGCSGYQYGLALVNKIEPADSIFETDGVRLVIDEVSIKYLQGATVDFVERMTSSGFKIINPNVLASCNCGQSFNSSEEGSNSTCDGCGQ